MAQPTEAEFLLPSHGWQLVLPATSGSVLRQAAETFQEYIYQAMDVEIALTFRTSLNDHSDLQRSIIVATSNELSECAATLTGPKDYRIKISLDRVVICGFDEAGAMYGLYNLQARMDLREAPILPLELDTTRHSLYQTRMTLSGLGWMEWPDAYLSLLSQYGFDAIYASDYANPTGAAAPLLYNYMRRQDPDRLKDLIKRASRYGISVYCPLMFQIMGDDRDEAELRELIRDTVSRFPEIRGYVLLIEGFLYGTLPQQSWTEEETRKWLSHWMRGVEIAADEFHKLDPTIKVLPWDYNLDNRPSAIDLKKRVVAQYPPTVIPLLTWENGKAFRRDGENGFLKDYAISEIGPAEVTAAQIETARGRGMRVFAKADAWASWQFGTFPYLPFPQQWLDRYKALERYKIDGTLESWTYGFQPNFIAELRAWYSWSDAPSSDELLASMARRQFGSAGVEFALAAWRHFSKAIALVPDTGPDMGTNNAIGSPLFLNKPEPRAMTLDHSWAEAVLGPGGGLNVSPYWPFAPRRLILEPDFTNRTNRAEEYARPFTLATFTKYLLAAAGEMEQGLENYRQAALDAEPFRAKGAYREVLLAEQIERMLRSEVAILEFEDLRFRLAQTSNAAQREQYLSRMEVIAKDELVRTEASYAAALRDSRFGYEWEQDYVYTPTALQEKLRQLKNVIEAAIPQQRRWTRERPSKPEVRGPRRPISKLSSARFFFTSDDSVTYECRLDKEPFGGCTNPQIVPELADGPHALEVRAKNPAGNYSEISKFAWTVDAASPSAVVRSGPRQPADKDRRASFMFEATKPGATFACRLSTEQDFHFCGASYVLNDLKDGAYTLLVKAIDPGGRMSDEPTSYSWTVDTVAPSGTRIVSGPRQPVSTDPSATFAFASADLSDTFECKLALEPQYRPCPNPHRIPPLPDGEYTLLVRARDGAGNVDPTPAGYYWKIERQTGK